MTRYQVNVAPSAREHVRRIGEWWEINRPAAPTLFADEFEAALGRLTATPTSVPVYRQSRGRVVRRLLMPRTSYHVYFEIDETAGVVKVVALWHGRRGTGPKL